MKHRVKRAVMALAMLLSVCSPLWAKEHVIERGETLQSIAKRYGVTTDKILEWNPEAQNMFYVGMVLQINETSAASSSITPSAETPAPTTFQPSTTPSARGYESLPEAEEFRPEKAYPQVGNFQLLFSYGLDDIGAFKYRCDYGFEVQANASVLKALYLGLRVQLSTNLGIIKPARFCVSILGGPSVALNKKATVMIGCPLGIRYTTTKSSDIVNFAFQPTISYASEHGVSLSAGVQAIKPKQGDLSGVLMIGIGYTF